MEGSRRLFERPGALIVVLVGVAMVTGMVPALGTSADAQAPDEVLPEAVPECVDHPPIQITEDVGEDGFVLGPEVEQAPFAAPTYRPGSGVVGGLGSEEHPYVIEGWCLTNQAPAEPAEEVWPENETALHIENTTAHVVVRDVVVPASGDFVHGIEFKDATNVTIENSTVTGTGRPAVVLQGSSDNVVRDNKVSENGHTGVVLRDSRDNRVVGNNLTDNEAHGVTVRDSSRGNVVSDNTIERNGVIGIWLLFSATDNLVLNNTVTDNNGLFGVGVMFSSHDNTIRENTVADNAGPGLRMRTSNGNEVYGNRLTGNSVHGVRVRLVCNTVIHNNTITGNAEDGIQSRRSCKNEIRDNVIADNAEHGLDLQGWANPQNLVLRGNNIHGNAGHGVAGGGAIDAVGNWWGHASGPSGGVEDGCTGAIADGEGDSVTASVCFDPWLEAPNPHAGAG